MHLFWEKGFGSTSVADILSRAGVNSGSLYHFFPGKQDLLVAVLDTYIGGIRQMLLEPAWRGVEDPIEKIWKLMDGYRDALVQTECTYGCPIGSLALELHEPDPVVRERLAKAYQEFRTHPEPLFAWPTDLLSEDGSTLVLPAAAVAPLPSSGGPPPFVPIDRRLAAFVNRLQEIAELDRMAVMTDCRRVARSAASALVFPHLLENRRILLFRLGEVPRVPARPMVCPGLCCDRPRSRRQTR